MPKIKIYAVVSACIVAVCGVLMANGISPTVVSAVGAVFATITTQLAHNASPPAP